MLGIPPAIINTLAIFTALLLTQFAVANDHQETVAAEAHAEVHAEAQDSTSDAIQTPVVAVKKPVSAGACGVIENVEGVVEVLSPDRKTLLPVHEKSDVECGSWVSTAQGWIRIRHIQGFTVQIGPETFVKIEKKDDHLTVFRGSLFGKSSKGNGEMRIATTNGRARIRDSSAMLIYQEQDAFTQLIAVEGHPSLENRFADNAKITIKPGESTSFHANLKRISPSTPKGAAVSSLRPKLIALHVEDGIVSRALKAAGGRVNRKFASIAQDREEDESEKAHAHAASDYSRSPASQNAGQRSHEDEFLANRWKQKLQVFHKKKAEVLKEISDVRPED